MGIWWDIMGHHWIGLVVWHSDFAWWLQWRYTQKRGFHHVTCGYNGDIIITTLVGGLNVVELCFIVRLSWGWWSLFTNNCWKGHGKPTILTLLMYVYIIIYIYTLYYIYIYIHDINFIVFFKYIYIYIIATTVNISWFASTMLYNQQWQYVWLPHVSWARFKGSDSSPGYLQNIFSKGPALQKLPSGKRLHSYWKWHIYSWFTH